jgi:hypothetical protein
VPNEEDSSNDNLGVGPKRTWTFGDLRRCQIQAQGDKTGVALLGKTALTRIRLWAPTDGHHDSFKTSDYRFICGEGNLCMKPMASPQICVWEPKHYAAKEYRSLCRNEHEKSVKQIYFFVILLGSQYLAEKSQPWINLVCTRKHMS